MTRRRMRGRGRSGGGGICEICIVRFCSRPGTMQPYPFPWLLLRCGDEVDVDETEEAMGGLSIVHRRSALVLAQVLFACPNTVPEAKLMLRVRPYYVHRVDLGPVLIRECKLGLDTQVLELPEKVFEYSLLCSGCCVLGGFDEEEREGKSEATGVCNGSKELVITAISVPLCGACEFQHGQDYKPRTHGIYGELLCVNSPTFDEILHVEPDHLRSRLRLDLHIHYIFFLALGLQENLG